MNGQSYDCPSIAAWRAVPALVGGVQGTGSLTTAPPLQLGSHPNDGAGPPRERAVLRLPLHCSCSMYSSEPMRPKERAVLRLPLHCSRGFIDDVKWRPVERAVLRLPLHCSWASSSVVPAAASRTGSLTTAPPLQPEQVVRVGHVERENGQSYDCPSIAALGLAH